MRSAECCASRSSHAECRVLCVTIKPCGVCRVLHCQVSEVVYHHKSPIAVPDGRCKELPTGSLTLGMEFAQTCSPSCAHMVGGLLRAAKP
eukprot:361851-Chlamydomonas_euryale.AAC.1